MLTFAFLASSLGAALAKPLLAFYADSECVEEPVAVIPMETTVTYQSDANWTISDPCADMFYWLMGTSEALTTAGTYTYAQLNDENVSYTDADNMTKNGTYSKEDCKSSGFYPSCHWQWVDDDYKFDDSHTGDKDRLYLAYYEDNGDCAESTMLAFVPLEKDYEEFKYYAPTEASPEDCYEMLLWFGQDKTNLQQPNKTYSYTLDPDNEEVTTSYNTTPSLGECNPSATYPLCQWAFQTPAFKLTPAPTTEPATSGAAIFAVGPVAVAIALVSAFA